MPVHIVGFSLQMLENLRLENEDKLKVKDQVFKDEQDRLQSEMQNMRFEFEKKLHDEKLRYENELNKQLSSNTELEDCKTVSNNYLQTPLHAIPIITYL